MTYYMAGEGRRQFGQTTPSEMVSKFQMSVRQPVGIAGLIAIFGIYYAPYVYMFTASALRNMDPSLEEAAEISGVGPVRTLFTVTFPLIAPAIISGWMLAFTLSLDDLVIASFASGPGATTLPMKIYSQVRLGVTPEINAIGTLVLAVSLTVMVAAQLLLRCHRPLSAG